MIKKPVEVLEKRGDEDVVLDFEDKYYLREHRPHGPMVKPISEEEAEEFVNET